jgi:YggT family protein
VEFVRLAAFVVDVLLLLYILVLLARLVLEYIPMFNRQWRPRGFGRLRRGRLHLTDPPLRFFRRLIPPLRIGPIALDLGFPVTMLACFVLLTIVRVIERL